MQCEWEGSVQGYKVSTLNCVLLCVYAKFLEKNFRDFIDVIRNVIYVLVKWFEHYQSGVIACSLNSRENAMVKFRSCLT